MSSYPCLYKAIPLAAIGAASQPFKALLATLLTDEDGLGRGFICFAHRITLLHRGGVKQLRFRS